MTARRESDGDVAEKLFEGQKMFWRGEPYPHDESEHQLGWLAAAGMAQSALCDHGDVLRNLGAVLVALTQAAAAIRSLRPAKPHPGQRQLASAALAAIEAALPHVQASAGVELFLEKHLPKEAAG